MNSNDGNFKFHVLIAGAVCALSIFSMVRYTMLHLEMFSQRIWYETRRMPTSVNPGPSISTSFRGIPTGGMHIGKHTYVDYELSKQRSFHKHVCIPAVLYLSTSYSYLTNCRTVRGFDMYLCSVSMDTVKGTTPSTGNSY